MCVANEDEPNAGSVSVGSYGGIGHLVVTAPRIGISAETYDRIDWTEVLPQTLIGIGAGYIGGGLPGALTSEIAVTASAIESQEGVDLVDLFQIQQDIIAVRGLPAPYVPLL
jgi:hypothetical protein